MGTRSLTAIIDEHSGKELCRIYRQYDGYPEGHGMDLAKLCDIEIVNGYSGDMKPGTHANGMGCLAAQIIQHLKAEHGLGGIYIMAPETNDVGEEYTYIIRGKARSKPTIECVDVFTGTAKQWLKKYKKAA